MIDYREVIRLKTMDYSNSRVASSTGCSRNKVAEIWKLAQDRQIAWPIPSSLTNEELKKILYPEAGIKDTRMMPDYEYIYNELAKPGVTLSLLWAEYCIKCEAAGKIPYQHTQFNERYHAYASSKKATLRLKRKPGEQLEVDWVGDTMHVTDPETGNPMTAYVFVACLPCSMYGYAEAFPDMKTQNWITAHVHAYDFFGGVTRILVPDNLKTGVIKNTRTELILNRSYHEMAEHYGTAIIPARPLKPRDKPTAEGTVKVIETWVMAALRNRTFFSFEELNRALLEKVNEFNDRPFQKKKGSRRSVFETEEKDFLMPLPASPYESAVWSTATIQPDYLISVGECKYSVPYEFIGKKVDIRTTDKVIEVFYHNNRIATHARRSAASDPVYNPDHMPEKHKKYLQYSAEHFLDLAADIGPSTTTVVKHFLYSHSVIQQGYKNCVSLMRLSEHYSAERLERACSRALSFTSTPSLKNITLILKNNQDKIDSKAPQYRRGSQYGIVRGTSYYGGGDRT